MSAPAPEHHKVVIVGGGTAGISTSRCGPWSAAAGRHSG